MTKVVSLADTRKAKEAQRRHAERAFADIVDLAVGRMIAEGWTLDQEGGFLIKGFRLHGYGATILFQLEELMDLLEYEGIEILGDALRMKEVFALSQVMNRMLQDENRGDWIYTIPNQGGTFDGY